MTDKKQEMTDEQRDGIINEVLERAQKQIDKATDTGWALITKDLDRERRYVGLIDIGMDRRQDRAEESVVKRHEEWKAHVSENTDALLSIADAITNK